MGLINRLKSRHAWCFVNCVGYCVIVWWNLLSILCLFPFLCSKAVWAAWVTYVILLLFLVWSFSVRLRNIGAIWRDSSVNNIVYIMLPELKRLHQLVFKSLVWIWMACWKTLCFQLHLLQIICIRLCSHIFWGLMLKFYIEFSRSCIILSVSICWWFFASVSRIFGSLGWIAWRSSHHSLQSKINTLCHGLVSMIWVFPLLCKSLVW